MSESLIIKSIELSDVSVPLITPFKTALRTAYSVKSTLLKITTQSGITGFGEAPETPKITGDTRGAIYSAVNDNIAPVLIGRDIADFENTMQVLQQSIVGNYSAKAAVDMAIYDIYAKSLNLPLYKLLGGAKTSLKTDITISLNDEKEMVKDSVKAVENGFNILKVKVGKQGSLQDANTMEQIRKAVGKDVVLRVDANQGWSPKQAVEIIKTMEQKCLDIDLVEQPVRADDLKGMQYITQSVYTKILADESVFSPKDAIEILKMGAADIINIKLMKCGGIYNALKICTIAQTLGAQCMMGCMLETKLATSAAAHFAAAKANVTRVDLDGPLLCSEDPFTGGPVFNGEDIIMSRQNGIGISDVPCDFA